MRRGAYAGQNYVACLANLARICRYRGSRAEPLQRELQRRDIGAAAGNDHDIARAQSVPLLLGISALSRRIA